MSSDFMESANYWAKKRGVDATHHSGFADFAGTNI